MAASMANPKCVAVKCEVKEIFDKALKPAVLKQVRTTVQTLVDKNKSKGIVFDPNCKDGWLLNVTVLSLELDDPVRPTSLNAEVKIEGVRMDGVTSGVVKATGSAKATGVRANQIEEKAKLTVHDAIESPMLRTVIPKLLKP
jgi:hypothetical protein